MTNLNLHPANTDMISAIESYTGRPCTPTNKYGWYAAQDFEQWNGKVPELRADEGPHNPHTEGWNAYRKVSAAYAAHRGRTGSVYMERR